ncbi:MAG: hypothetical protein KBT29_07045 [Prevotellaceae bacterium]|nr:hypothetical protein [Candidatus Minthosoma caballi]
MKKLNLKYYILLSICCLMSFAKATAQVTVESKLDSAGIFIGQRIGLTLEVSAEAGKNVEMPEWDSLQQVVPGLEFVRSEKADTSYMNEGKTMLLSKRYYFTSFDSALYLIPEMDVKVDGKSYLSKKLALKVVTFEVDTLHADSIFGMKTELAPPFDWAEWRLVIIFFIIALLIAALMGYVIYRLKNNKPILRRIRTKKHVAPHKAAMQKIEQIKEEKIWQSEDSKEYYTQLTDTLREYIKERYGFNAMEMTSYEIIQKLQEVNDEQAIGELRELFQTADLVKFAKYSTLINENDRNLVSAIEYINQTKLEEPEEKPQPEVIVVEEKRSKIAKRVLIASIVVAGLVLLGVLGFVGYRIYMLTL